MPNTYSGDAALFEENVPAIAPLEEYDGAPLCIDLDGTLIYSDLLIESISNLLVRNPLYLLALPFWLLRGRAFLKRRIAGLVKITPSLLPYNEKFLEWIKIEKSAGRHLVLATASDRGQAQAIADYVGVFDEVLASNGSANLKGAAKLKRLRERFGTNFDYAGNSRADLPVWMACQQAVVVGASSGLLKKALRQARVVRIFERKFGGLKPLLECLRVHQWSKNFLIFVPLITSHQLLHWTSLRSAFLSFFSFSLCASAAYILNDLLDLESDRRHPMKRLRPFASGRVSAWIGLVLAPVLMISGVALSLLLPRASLKVLLVYIVLTFVYSLRLKRLVLVDVFTLATLYTIRLVAGQAAYSIALSSWLLSFSMFLFLSLGFCKRTSELYNMRRQSSGLVHGRTYCTTDLEQINLFGVASGFLSSLVLTLYMQSGEIRALYKQPELLWLLFPLLLYWISRIWILTHRGEMNEDAVLFAIKDKVTWLVGLSAATLLFLATHLRIF